MRFFFTFWLILLTLVAFPNFASGDGCHVKRDGIWARYLWLETYENAYDTGDRSAMDRMEKMGVAGTFKGDETVYLIKRLDPFRSDGKCKIRFRGDVVTVYTRWHFLDCF